VQWNEKLDATLNSRIGFSNILESQALTPISTRHCIIDGVTLGSATAIQSTLSGSIGKGSSKKVSGQI
jgi:hypothetical protein